MINLMNNFEIIDLLKRMSAAEEKGAPAQKTLEPLSLKLSDVLRETAERFEEAQE